MADRYEVRYDALDLSRSYVFDVTGADEDGRSGRLMADARTALDAKRIVDALNAQDKLAKLIWGPEGCPEWLKDA